MVMYSLCLHIARGGRFVLARMGQEPRLGRCWRVMSSDLAKHHYYPLFLQIARSGKFVLAGMGQEPRLGRWARDKKARNGLLLHQLTLQHE